MPQFDWSMMDAIVPVVLQHVKGCIIEIGMGVSTSILYTHAEDANVRLFSCDIHPRALPLGQYHVVLGMKSEQMMDEYDRIFDGSRPAVVFIDGLHEANTVRKEVAFFLSKLLVGGIIFMHDTLPKGDSDLRPGRCGDVYKVRQELERNPEVDVLTWPYTANGYGLTMVRKKPQGDIPVYRQ